MARVGEMASRMAKAGGVTTGDRRVPGMRRVQRILGPLRELLSGPTAMRELACEPRPEAPRPRSRQRRSSRGGRHLAAGRLVVLPSCCRGLRQPHPPIRVANVTRHHTQTRSRCGATHLQAVGRWAQLSRGAAESPGRVRDELVRPAPGLEGFRLCYARADVAAAL